MDKDQLKVAKDFFSKYSSTSDAPIEDLKTKEEKRALFGGNLENLDDWLRHETFRLEKKDKESERELRRTNANRSFWFSFGWALFIGTIIVLKGFCKNFNFTQTEYLATIGTLSVTILTYYLVVIKSLFPNENRKQSK